MPDTINFENVTFTYPAYGAEAGPALSHVSLTIHSGESISLIGSNGSGKSTLAKLMNALLLPDSGQVTVFGMDSSDSDKQFEIRSQVGLVFQRPQHQIVATTVGEDVAFGPGNLGLEPGEVRARVEDALRRTGLENYHQRYSFQLSAAKRSGWLWPVSWRCIRAALSSMKRPPCWTHWAARWSWHKFRS
jgi:energy-coupling factor transporter ATP-binding protein EcfA2